MDREVLRSRLRSVLAAKNKHRGPTGKECIHSSGEYLQRVRENRADHDAMAQLAHATGATLLDVTAARAFK